MKLSVCIDSVLKGWELSEALSFVKKAGIDAFEFWDWKKKDTDLMVAEMQKLDLSCSAFCTVGGKLADRSTHKEYIQGLKETVNVAKKLKCHTLITTVGNELQDVPRELQLESVAQGLQAAAPIVEDAGITLVLEPLNTLVDHPGHLLSLSSEAFDIVDQVGSKHVKVLFDIYHQQITEGNLIATMTDRLSDIGHIHAAGCPGRHELQFGEIYYKNVIQALRKKGYAAHFGLEYVPELEPADGLRYARALFNE